MTPLVITPTLGRSRFLAETIASVAAVRPRCRHVLVCPREAESPLRDQWPELAVIGSDARGVYPAIEAGLGAGGSWDVWTWLNDDDRFRPESLSRALARLSEAPALDGIYGRVDYCDARGASLGPLPVETCPARLRRVFCVGLPGLTQQGTFVRRELAETLGGFDPRFRLAGDFDYWARALAAGARFVHHPEVVADYRLHRGQLSTDTAAVAREIEASVEARFPAVERAQAWRLRVRMIFRLAHLPGLFRRFLLTGYLRTSTLYRLAAEREVHP